MIIIVSFRIYTYIGFCAINKRNLRRRGYIIYIQFDHYRKRREKTFHVTRRRVFSKVSFNRKSILQTRSSLEDTAQKLETSRTSLEAVRRELTEMRRMVDELQQRRHLSTQLVIERDRAQSQLETLNAQVRLLRTEHLDSEHILLFIPVMQLTNSIHFLIPIYVFKKSIKLYASRGRCETKNIFNSMEADRYITCYIEYHNRITSSFICQGFFERNVWTIELKILSKNWWL